MNKFSKLFAVLFLVSSVAAFAGQVEDAAVTAAQDEVSNLAPDASGDVKTAAQLKLDAAKKAQAAANKADAEAKSYKGKVKAFAAAAKAKANTIAFGDILEAKKDGKFYDAAYYLKQGVNKGLRPVVVVVAAFGAYKLYKNRAVEADETDDFEDAE